MFQSVQTGQDDDVIRSHGFAYQRPSRTSFNVQYTSPIQQYSVSSGLYMIIFCIRCDDSGSYVTIPQSNYKQSPRLFSRLFRITSPPIQHPPDLSTRPPHSPKPPNPHTLDTYYLAAFFTVAPSGFGLPGNASSQSEKEYSFRRNKQTNKQRFICLENCERVIFYTNRLASGRPPIKMVTL